MTQTTPKRYTWTEVTEEKMSPLLTRRVVHGESTSVARIELRKGAFVPEHAHANEQISAVEHGVLEFQFGAEKVVLRAGEFLVIPPNVPHSAMALEDCIAVDVFSPRREDWIRGDDAYLRK